MENGDALYARIAELEEENTYTTVALLYGKKYNLKYWQCIGTGTNGKVTLPNMIALKKSCTCHVCGYLEEDIKQSDQLVCGCDVCNLPLCDHCRATDDENEVVDDSICQDCYDNMGYYECGCTYKAAAGGFCGTRFVDKYGCTTESRILYSGEWESDCDEHYQSEERYVCINCADEWKEALGMYEDGDEQYYKANAPQDLTACEMNKAWQSAHNTKRNMPVGDVINEFLDFLCEIPQEERCVSKNLHEWQRKRTQMKLAFKQWALNKQKP
jgi:hypothetical protein